MVKIPFKRYRFKYIHYCQKITIIFLLLNYDNYVPDLWHDLINLLTSISEYSNRMIL